MCLSASDSIIENVTLKNNAVQYLFLLKDSKNVTIKNLLFTYEILLTRNGFFSLKINTLIKN